MPALADLETAILACAAWLLWAWVCPRLLDNPRRDPAMGLLFAFLRLYSRAWHRLTVLGRENVPASLHPGPLILVANHTAGVDPVLVQAACPFEIQWMMARDMMEPALDGLWKWAGVIPVDRSGKDSTSAKQAIAHVREGKVLGVFPEGRLGRPARHILPFLPGLGIMIKRTGARVLPVIIDGTPEADPAWASICLRGNARLRFMPVIDYAATKLGPSEIVEDLRRRYADWTGWPLIEAPDLDAAMRE